MMKRFFLMAIAATTLFSCAKDEENLLPQDGGKAYLALNFSNVPISKANTPETGTAGESKINAATVLLFDATNNCIGSRSFTAVQGKPATEAVAVPLETTKVFVVVNNPAGKWDLTDANVIGKQWSVINESLAIVDTDIATNDNFTMTNAGINSPDSNGDNITDQALAGVKIHKTADAAKNDPAIIFVDRVAAKIEVTSGTPTSANGVFAFLGWDLNTVNLKTALYTKRQTYADASTGQIAAIYRVDHNYLTADLPADNALATHYKWLTNGTDKTTISSVNKASAAVAYCTENTMAADAQLWGHTTKVVIKGEYTPTTDATGSALTPKASYFMWNNSVYAVANMINEYKKAGKDNLKADLIIFLAEANTTFNALSADDRKIETNIDTAIGQLDEYSGIAGKYNAVQYFHLSVCYYDALIRHDNNVSTKMALGRYGVVRNNSYAINVTNVKGPGTPWIPDPTDPADPSKPTDPDDISEANLSINIIINPWTRWAHDVELGN